MSAQRATDSDFTAVLAERAQAVNRTLEELLDQHSEMQPRLSEALRYTLVAPGKRVRAALLLWCCELVCGRVNRNAEIAAAVVEIVHTYSLVHDDLPAMDDDELRRGRPTCHKVFDEATAILTGDALVTLAFEILADGIDSSETAVRLISHLAKDAGGGGMIAGQMADLEAESNGGDERLLEYIHSNKTAKMFRCAAVMGAICGGGDDKQIDLLGEYGLRIGLGFQIADDILDVSASSEQLGKTAGKDQKAEKCTYPSVVGIDEARQRERDLARQAVECLRPFGDGAEVLRHLAMALLQRRR